MNRHDWINVNNFTLTIKSLHDIFDKRKLRLLDCACGWELRHWFFNNNLIQSLERAERYADEEITKSTLRKWEQKIIDTIEEMNKSADYDPKVWMASHIVQLACLPASESHALSGTSWSELDYPEQLFGSRVDYFSPEWLLEMKNKAIRAAHDIFGNPFMPTTFNMSWRSSTVFALAKTIYRQKAFDRLPILADALQEAGCDSEDVLSHCRQGGDHVKGCWALDLALGKSDGWSGPGATA